jgi:hypothetical protein
MKYSNLFDAAFALHKMQVGNDCHKSKTLYRGVYFKVRKEHALESLQNLSKVLSSLHLNRDKKKGQDRTSTIAHKRDECLCGNRSIDYQSMPDGSCDCALVYHNHSIKFCQLCPSRNRTH